jgi:hypothetical protein
MAKERGGAHQKASLRWRGPAAGKRWRQAGVGVTGGVRAVGKEVLSGTVLGVGSRLSKKGWSGLSTVTWVGRRGTTTVIRTRGRRHRLAGGSGHRWGPRGGDNEGVRWPEMATVDEARSVEMAHDVGWLRGLFTMAGSRLKRRLRTVLLLSGVAWALKGVGVRYSGGRGER